jgi:hypothetical protein
VRSSEALTRLTEFEYGEFSRAPRHGNPKEAMKEAIKCFTAANDARNKLD